jgi:hypothetical protein
VAGEVQVPQLKASPQALATVPHSNPPSAVVHPGKGPEHGPQSSVPPHPSEIVPHDPGCAAQVVRWQTSQLCVTASQTWPPSQFPHCSVPPQPSGSAPQVARSAVQVEGTHAPHWCVCPSHSPEAQVPQNRGLPQASTMYPQEAAASVHTV